MGAAVGVQTEAERSRRRSGRRAEPGGAELDVVAAIARRDLAEGRGAGGAPAAGE